MFVALRATYRSYTVPELLGRLYLQPYDLLVQQALQERLPEYIQEIEGERELMRDELKLAGDKLAALREAFDRVKEHVEEMEEALAEAEGAVETAAS